MELSWPKAYRRGLERKYRQGLPGPRELKIKMRNRPAGRRVTEGASFQVGMSSGMVMRVTSRHLGRQCGGT
jgi:hypothetical protein